MNVHNEECSGCPTEMTHGLVNAKICDFIELSFLIFMISN